MATINSFRDLECWKEGRNFRLMIREYSKHFPDFEKYSLTSQVIRSSRSVCDNIAEGFGRYHYQENTQYCRQARGSLNEAFNQCITALDEGYINEAEFERAEKQFDKTLAILNGYINYLQRAKVGESA
jgi:four helix bundle protein